MNVFTAFSPSAFSPSAFSPSAFESSFSFRQSAPLSPFNPNAACRQPPAFYSETMSFGAASRPGHFKAPSRCHEQYRARLRDPQQRRDQQRNAYLKKVKERGDDRKYETRREQVGGAIRRHRGARHRSADSIAQALRRDFLEERRAWEREQERVAAAWDARPEDEEALPDLDGRPRALERRIGSDQSSEQRFVEECLSQEEQELEAMLITVERSPAPGHEPRSDPTDYGSDDEEYQQLLMEAAREAERAAQPQAASQHQDQSTDVTMS